MSFRKKRASLLVLGSVLILFLGYQAVVLCLIYAKVTAFVSSNYTTNTDTTLGAKFTITRFEPEWQENFGWVIRRDVRRYHKDAFYILPSNLKADTEFNASLAIYRQSWGR